MLADERRAQRFLDLTGLGPEQVRAGIETAELHVAVLDFLCAHEPDLLAAAESLDVEPQVLAAARERLRR